MCVSIYVCLYICMHICIYVYVCTYIHTHTHTHTHTGTALVAGALMLVPAVLNWRMLPSKVSVGEDNKGKATAASKGLNLGEIINVLKIPACRTLTIYMMMAGLAGRHSRKSSRAWLCIGNVPGR